MTLVDTSIWVNHFRASSPKLVELIAGRAAGMHPFIIGELAVGNLKGRAATLAYLGRLPKAAIAQETEVHHLLESRRLWGTGVGWIDLHLLASAALAGWDILTADQTMRKAAKALGLAHEA